MFQLEKRAKKFSIRPFSILTEQDRALLGDGFNQLKIKYDYMGYPVSFECTSEEGNFMYEDHPKRVNDIADHFDPDYDPQRGYSPSAKQ